MPTYDYICDGCGHEFEAFESIKAEPQTDCPECKDQKLRRKIGPGAAILFKGSGFYQTDYRSESYKKAAKAEKTLVRSRRRAPRARRPRARRPRAMAASPSPSPPRPRQARRTGLRDDPGALSDLLETVLGRHPR